MPNMAQKRCLMTPFPYGISLEMSQTLPRIQKKVHLKRDSEENAVAKPASESKRVTFKEENEDETVVKPEENEKNEDLPDYRQLRKMLAAMITQEQLKDRDEK